MSRSTFEIRGILNVFYFLDLKFLKNFLTLPQRRKVALSDDFWTRIAKGAHSQFRSKEIQIVGFGKS